MTSVGVIDWRPEYLPPAKSSTATDPSPKYLEGVTLYTLGARRGKRVRGICSNDQD